MKFIIFERKTHKLDIFTQTNPGLMLRSLCELGPVDSWELLAIEPLA